MVCVAVAARCLVITEPFDLAPQKLRDKFVRYPVPASATITSTNLGSFGGFEDIGTGAITGWRWVTRRTTNCKLGWTA
jgi:hypothetical protein